MVMFHLTRGVQLNEPQNWSGAFNEFVKACLAKEAADGNMRAFRNQCIAHFRSINRRFQQEWELNSLLHITAQEVCMCS